MPDGADRRHRSHGHRGPRIGHARAAAEALRARHRPREWHRHADPERRRDPQERRGSLGSQREAAVARAHRLQPARPLLVPHRVEAFEHLPVDGGACCSCRTTQVRSPPTRRRSCTGSRPSSDGRCTASPSTCSARFLSSARCPHRRWRDCEPRQRVPAVARRRSARARVPRGHEGHGQALQRALPIAALRPWRLRRDRDFALAYRSCRSRCWAPKNRCRSCGRATGSPSSPDSPTCR